MEQSTGEQAVTRRDALKKAAVAGAAVAWAAPTVQFLGQGVAGAQVFGSTCPGCVNSFTFNTDLSDSADGDPLAITRLFSFTCGGGGVGSIVGTAWTTSNTVNATPFTSTGNTITAAYTGTGGAAASTDFTCTVTFRCTCFQGGEESIYACTSTGSASWPAPANQVSYGTASGSDPCTRCP